MVEVRSKCEAHCPDLKKELAKCTERVSSRSNTEETCTQELFDFLHCVDHCVRLRCLLCPVNCALPIQFNHNLFTNQATNPPLNSASPPLFVCLFNSQMSEELFKHIK